MGNIAVAIRNEVRQRIREKLRDTNEEKFEFSENEIKLSNLPVTKLREMIISTDQNSSKNLSLIKLLKIFHYKKQLDSNKNNAFADVFYKSALRQAHVIQQIVDSRDSEKTCQLSSLGLILSVKEHMIYKNSGNTQGLISCYGLIAKRSADLFLYLEEKGALITCKGNVCEFILNFETGNLIYGTTCHPIKRDRTCGGSSGGDAVLISTGLVNAGIGTDIGGSLRVPTLFCGIYSLKPTAGRFDYSCVSMPYQDHQNFGYTDENQCIIEDTIGPMARYLSDLQILAREINNFNLNQKKGRPLPWVQPKTPKRIGYILEFDQIFKLPECTHRAFEIAKKSLLDSGLELVPINLNDIISELDFYTKAAFFKNMEFNNMVLKKSFDKGPFSDAYSEHEKFLLTPVAKLIKQVNEGKIDPRNSNVVKAYIFSSQNNQMTIQFHKRELTNEVIRRFQDARVDCALEYGLFPAPKLQSMKFLQIGCIYCYIWNFLNFPVGVMPITKVRYEEQRYFSAFNDKIDKIMVETMKESENLPIGVQVVGLPWKETLVLEAMKLIDDKI